MFTDWVERLTVGSVWLLTIRWLLKTAAVQTPSFAAVAVAAARRPSHESEMRTSPLARRQLCFVAYKPVGRPVQPSSSVEARTALAVALAVASAVAVRHIPYPHPAGIDTAVVRHTASVAVGVRT